MVQALLIDHETVKAIAAVVDYAHKHPFTKEYIEKMFQQKLEPAGDNLKHTCIIKHGYRCVFSIDSDRQGRMLRHLSVSVEQDNPKKEVYAHPKAVQIIMQAFGFKKSLGDKEVLLSKEAGEAVAVNIFEYLPPN